MSKLRVVIALGDSALRKNSAAPTEIDKTVAEKLGSTIAKLSAKYEIIISYDDNSHWLSQTLSNALIREHKRKRVAGIVTQVVVDRDDPAFKHPSKFIGESYTAKESLKLIKTRGWNMREDAGRGFRRIVPSPKPIDIVERREIISLVQSGDIVIAVGGGMPVVRSKVLKTLKGVDALIDKDLAAEKLAELVKADIFVSVTAVPNAYINYGESDQIALGIITPAEIMNYIRASQFGADSMLPKIQAAMQFAKKKRLGIITSPENLELALARRSGTIVQG